MADSIRCGKSNQDKNTGARHDQAVNRTFASLAVFLFHRKDHAGIICLILQLTVIGWIPAAIWAVYALSQYNTDKKIAEAHNNSND